jgi:hypothetical protein
LSTGCTSATAPRSANKRSRRPSKEWKAGRGLGVIAWGRGGLGPASFFRQAWYGPRVVRASLLALVLAACAAGAALAGPSSSPGCSGFVTGEDEYSTVSIGGCKSSVKEIDLKFPQAAALAATYTLNGYGSTKMVSVPSRHLAANVSEAFKFKTPLPPGTRTKLERGATFSSWFEVALQELPAGERVYVTTVGTDGSRQTFYVTIVGMPYGA